MLKNLISTTIIAIFVMASAQLGFADTVQITKSSGALAPPKATALNLGKIEVALPPCNQGGEFPTKWSRELTFVQAPDSICVRWTEAAPITSFQSNGSKWDILKVVEPAPATLKSVGTGNGPHQSIGESATSLIFSIKLQPTPLPEFNKTGVSQKYQVKIASTTPGPAPIVALLIQKPEPPPADPYTCASAPAGTYTRKIWIGAPSMTVNQTTSTSGDGDRDELYFEVGAIGPGTANSQTRLPENDDYFQAFNGKSVDINGWTDKDKVSVSFPVFWAGKLADGESTVLSVTALEQDNADEKNIKSFVVGAFQAIATGAAAVGGPVGGTVSAVAGTAGALSNAFIPNTDGQDFIGVIGVVAENHCGYIKLSWLTFKSVKTPAGTISNNFQVINGTGEDYLSRLEVIRADTAGFLPSWPYGVDWGGFTYLDSNNDQFWWTTHGTSQSQYTFLLKAMVLTP